MSQAPIYSTAEQSAVARALRQVREAEAQRKMDRKTREVLAAAEARRAQNAVKKHLKQVQDKEELDRLNASLISQGKVAPQVSRDDVGRKITRWIGSPKGAFASFMEPAMKSSMAETGRRLSTAAKQRREQAAYAALARETGRGSR
jgi:hypothetical protein